MISLCELYNAILYNYTHGCDLISWRGWLPVRNERRIWPALEDACHDFAKPYNDSRPELGNNTIPRQTGLSPFLTQTDFYCMT